MADRRSKPVELVTKQLLEWARAGVDNLASGRARGPIRELHMELTHRCDLKCVMCHHWEMPARDRGSVGRELTVSEISRFTGGSRLLRGVEFVAVTGGEPWSRPEAVEIVALLRRRFPAASLGVLTNFWNTGLIRRRLQELVGLGVKGLWLGTSLDGIGDMHDRIRGQTGAFDGFLRTLAMIREDFPEIELSMNFTILPENRRQLWEAYAFAKEHRLNFGAQFVVNHEGYQAPQTFAWKDAELAEVEAQIDRVLSDLCASHQVLARLVARPPAESRWLWNKLLFWWYLRKHGRGSPRFFDDCMAGERYAMLDPEGNLFFCPVNKHKQAGNVRDGDFDAVWSSARAERLRAELIPCQCRCWLNCIANPILDRVTGLALAEESRA